MKNMKIIYLLILLFSIQSLSAQDQEDYYFNKVVNGTFGEVTDKVKSKLKEQGFGVITEIDMHIKIKEKLTNAEMNPYRILGVCNPSFAYQTLQVEENIGLFLPCKVIIKDLGNGKIEVVMVNPSALMNMLGNKDLENIASKVTDKFSAALGEL